MFSKIKKFLDKRLPQATYSTGKKSKCTFYNLCSAFDITDD